MRAPGSGASSGSAIVLENNPSPGRDAAGVGTGAGDKRGG